MNDRNIIYLGALLHDIGKFLERGKLKEWKEKAEKYVINNEVSRNYAHRRYSAAFIDYLLNLKKEFIDRSIESIVLLHHKGDDNSKYDYDIKKNIGLKLQIIKIADNFASAERREDNTLDDVNYYLAKLQSPFCNISLDERKIPENENNIYLRTGILTNEKESMFPNSENSNLNNQYCELVIQFLSDVRNIDDEDALLNLMEKYLTNVPAQTPFKIKDKDYLYKPDINLFDHSRTTAAISLCLWDEYENGNWKNKDNFILDNNYESLSSPCILINGNFSGIQDFIFNITSEKAARKLKARSFFVQLFSEVVAKYFVDKLDLKQSNVLYNGGGNMFILAPANKRKFVDQCYYEISKATMNLDLFFALGIVDVSLNDFKDFGVLFSNASKEADKSKRRKYKNLKYVEVFNPKKQVLKEDSKFEILADELMSINDYAFFTKKTEYPINEQRYQAPFYELGYSLEIHKNQTGISKECFLLNSTNFCNDYKGFKFAVVKVPVWSRKKLEELRNSVSERSKDKLSELNEDYENGIKTFKAFSIDSWLDTGTQKIGVLKLDVDNLGRIFSSGIKEGDRTISRIASLSRNIKWFFDAYISYTLQKEEFKDKIYTIFSGGDDFFIVGAWNKVFDFAIFIRKEFEQFVCNNKAITLSASLLVLDENYPVSRFAQIADLRIHKAKEMRKEKDAISIFETVISWDDFFKTYELTKKLVHLIKNYKVERSILDKIRKSSKGFEKLQINALNGKIELNRVWRLSYYLRDLLKSRNDSNEDVSNYVKKEIIGFYEKLVINALEKKSTEIKIFPLAARWAEFLTRN